MLACLVNVALLHASLWLHFLLLFGAPILHHNFLGLLSLLAVSPPDGDCGVIFSAAVAFWHGCGRSTVVSPIPSGSCCPLEKHIVVIFILMQSLSVQQCNNHSNKILSSLSLSSSALLLRLLFWHHLPLTFSSQYSVFRIIRNGDKSFCCDKNCR